MTNLVGTPEFQKYVSDLANIHRITSFEGIEAKIGKELDIRVPILKKLAIEVASAAKNKGVIESDFFTPERIATSGVRKFFSKKSLVWDYTPTDKGWVIRDETPFDSDQGYAYGIFLNNTGDLKYFRPKSTDDPTPIIPSGYGSMPFEVTTPISSGEIETSLYEIEFINDSFDALAQFVRHNDL